MKILNNPILGLIFARYSLMLNDKGLFRKVVVKGQKDLFIEITDDPKVICDIMGIDFNRINNASEEFAFIEIMSCVTFAQYLFLEDKEHTGFFGRFFDFVQKNKLEENNFVPITTQRIEDTTGMSLEDKINEYKSLVEKIPLVKSNFDRMKSVLIDSGYDVADFNIDIPRFKKSFNQYEYYKLMTSGLDAILNEYCKINKYLLNYDR